MEIGKIILQGIDVVSIENISITAEFNEHATLKIKCLVEDEALKECGKFLSSNQEITLKEEDDILFQGNVVGLRGGKDSYKSWIEFVVKNSTWMLDKDKKSKSYQDVTKTYQDLVETKTKCLFQTDNKVVGELVLQYQETDWQFLCRIASKCNQPIYADMTKTDSILYWGVDKNKSAKEPEIRLLSSEKDLEWVKRINGNEDMTLLEDEATIYTIESPDFFKLGDAILVDGKELIIYKLSINADRAEVCGTYYAKRASALVYPTIYSYDMAGVSLQGEVIAAQGTDVKVHLSIDDKQDEEGAYWFPFSAMQAAADGSGWYYMPEKGDCVKVCIPAWEEKGTFAVSAVSTYDGKSDAEDKMADTSVKYMLNPSGKEMQLTNTGISAGVSGGDSSINMDINGNVNLFGKESYSIEASEAVTLFAMKNMEIKASTSIDLKARTTGELIFDENGEITELGGQVNINAED